MFFRAILQTDGMFERLGNGAELSFGRLDAAQLFVTTLTILEGEVC